MSSDASVTGGASLDAEQLRTLFLFEKLDDAQLAWLTEHGRVMAHPAGSVIIREGDPAEHFLVLLEGTVVMSRRVGQDDVETVRTDQVGVYAGATQSYVAESVGNQTYATSLRAITDVRVFCLKATEFAGAMREWFPMAIHLLEGLFLGMRTSQNLVMQRQQLLALGALTAGLTHELNNPAAAAVRATSTLGTQIAGMRHKLAMLAHDKLDPRLLQLLVDVQEDAVTGIADAPRLTAVQEAEREDQLSDWMQERGVSGGWELAPVFVAAGTTIGFLDRIAGAAPPGLLEGALRWLGHTLETELLLGEITDSVTRISSLVAAAKQYSNMDRAPHERTDLHLGLKSTLIMMADKLGGILVVKDFDRDLPPVPMFVGEINQVWTNLIDNAIQAMDGSGTLRITTSLDGDHARVEIADTGPGIAEDIRTRIFEPFFTTKSVGQGTGLGLDISYRIVVRRHGGDIRVESQPGDTRFTVRLPLSGRPPT